MTFDDECRAVMDKMISSALADAERMPPRRWLERYGGLSDMDAKTERLYRAAKRSKERQLGL